MRVNINYIFWGLCIFLLLMVATLLFTNHNGLALNMTQVLYFVLLVMSILKIFNHE